MSVDQPSSAAVDNVKPLAMKTRTCSTSASGEPHPAPTETDSQWMPKQGHPKSDPTAQKPWEPETADFCATKPQLRSCSENEVVDGEFAISQSEATQLHESPETAFAGLVRERRGEVRVSTRTVEERTCSGQTVRVQQLHEEAAVQAATRSGVHSTALMRM